MADQDLDLFSETTVIEDTDLIAVYKKSGDSLWRDMTGASLKKDVNVSDPPDATDTGTDVYEVDLGKDVASGEAFVADFDSANTTASPTLENIGGAPAGAQSIVDISGNAYIGMLEAKPHKVQWDGTNFVLLDPASVVQIIQSGSVSGGSALTITDLSTDFRKYEVVFDNLVPENDAVSMILRTSTDNGSSFNSGASDYNDVSHVTRAASGGGQTSAEFGAVGTTEITLSSGKVGTGTGEILSGSIKIHKPADSGVRTSARGEHQGLNSDGDYEMGESTGERAAAEANDAVRITFSSGGFASLNYILYGYR